MVDVATLGLAVKFDQVDRASGSLDKFSGAADRAEKSAQGMGKGAETAARKAAAANDNAARSADKAAAAYGKWHTAALRMANVLGAIGGALATAAVFRYADAWSDMQSRVGAAVKDMEAAPALMQRMVDIANASYSPLDQTVEVYSRNVAVLRDLGKGATEAADFTEALNHALVLTATRGERAASVQNALSKAMAVGKLQAEGLETILANGGEVAQVLADKMGTTVSGLRGLASQGKITGDVIATALIGRLDDLRERAGEMPATIGDAFTRLQTNLTAFIGQMDQATGASQRISDAIMLLANNIDVIARVAAVAGVAMALYFGPAALGAIAFGLGYVGAAGVAAMTAIKVAVMANPIGFLVTALTTAVTAAYLFRDEIQQAIGVDVIGIVKTAANYIIGSFVAAYEDIKFVWNNFPTIMSAAITGAVNFVIRGVNSMVNAAIDGINKLIQSLNDLASFFGADKAAQFFGFSGKIDKIGPWGGVNEWENPAAADLGAAVSERNAAIQSALSRDYIGELGEIVFGTKSATEATDAMTTAIKAANDNLSQTEGAAGKAAKGIADVKQEADKAAESAIKFGADLVKGFVSDLRSGLEQGKGFWRSFGDAAMNVLDKIVDKLLNNVIDALFQVNSVGSAGGGGGFLSAIFGGIGRLFGFASGGYTGPGAASTPAGIVHAGEYVMSKSAVDRLGVGYLDALHNAAKGYQMGGYVRSHAPANVNMRGYQAGGYVQRHSGGQEVVKIELVSRFDADGGFEQAVERSSRPVAMQESAKAAGQVARAVPSMALGAMDNSRTRRIRTISPGGGL